MDGYRVASFFPGTGCCAVVTYRETDELMSRGKSFATTQMSFLCDPRILDYDRIHILEVGKHDVTIENNHDGTWSCENTNRSLRHGHDLFRLWKAGEFE